MHRRDSPPGYGLSKAHEEAVSKVALSFLLDGPDTYLSEGDSNKLTKQCLSLLLN